VVRNNLVFANGGNALGLLGCGSESLCGSQVTSSARVINNTFWRNVLVSRDFDNGEIAIEGGSGGTFENNLVGYDQAPAFFTDGTEVLTSDYNGFHNVGTGGFAFAGGAMVGSFQQWQSTGFDPHSLEADPLFSAATSDFHLSSTAGFFDSAGVLHGDARTSPFIERGDPTTPIGRQRAPNAGRTNAGAYGGTEEASLTPVGLSPNGGDGQHGAAGSVLPVPLGVAVTFRPEGFVAAKGVEVAFDVISGDGQVSAARVVTDEVGLASTQLKLGAAPSTTVRASLPNVLDAGEVTFTAFVGTPNPDAGPPDAGPPATFGVCGCTSGEGRLGAVAMFLMLVFFTRPRRQFDFRGGRH